MINKRIIYFTDRKKNEQNRSHNTNKPMKNEMMADFEIWKSFDWRSNEPQTK